MPPALKRLEPADLIRGAWVALILALAFAIFHFFGVTDVGYDARIATRSAFVWLWRRWQGEWNQTAFAHGQWIPLIFLLLLWQRRRELRDAAGPANRWGLVVLMLALAAHWIGARAQQTRLSLAAFALMAWAVPFYAAGWPVARRMAFPCAFLLLAMPLNFLEGAMRPLRAAAVKIAALLLGGFGLEAGTSGSQILLRGDRGFALDLADFASGMHAFMALATLVLAGGCLLRLSARRRLLLLALVPPAFVASNILRALLFALPGAAFGSTSTPQAFARWSGLVQFLSGALLLALGHALLHRERLRAWSERWLRPMPTGGAA